LSCFPPSFRLFPLTYLIYLFFYPKAASGWETGYASAPSRRPKFALAERNAPGEEIAGVAVAVAEGDAEHPWRHQGAIYGDNRERDWQAIIGAQSRDRDGMRHGVIANRSDLRGMEIGSRTRIAEVFAFRLLIAIVVMEMEVGGAAILAGLVTVPVCRVADRPASACAGDKVIGANDVDQVEEDAA